MQVPIVIGSETETAAVIAERQRDGTLKWRVPRGSDVALDAVMRSAQELQGYFPDELLMRQWGIWRVYIDVGAHLEFAAPEAADAWRAARRFHSQRFLANDAVRRAREQNPQLPEIQLIANNSDGQGQSYGFHENYGLPMSVVRNRAMEIKKVVSSHITTRAIYTGEGEVLSADRARLFGREGPTFVISQRFPHMTARFEKASTKNRGLINLRGEPLADPERFVRCHVMGNDTNLHEVATYLTFGPTAMVFNMLADRVNLSHTVLAEPSAAGYREGTGPWIDIAFDLDMNRKLLLANGNHTNVIDHQAMLLDAAKDWFRDFDVAKRPGGGVHRDVISRWEHALTKLESNPLELAGTVGWVLKREVQQGFVRKRGLAWDDAAVQQLGLQWHGWDDESGVFHWGVGKGRLPSERLFNDDELRSLYQQPEQDTRSVRRHELILGLRELQRSGRGRVTSINWHGVTWVDSGQVRPVHISLGDPKQDTDAEMRLPQGEALANYLDRLSARQAITPVPAAGTPTAVTEPDF